LKFNQHLLKFYRKGLPLGNFAVALEGKYREFLQLVRGLPISLRERLPDAPRKEMSGDRLREGSGGRAGHGSAAVSPLPASYCTIQKAR